MGTEGHKSLSGEESLMEQEVLCPIRQEASVWSCALLLTRWADSCPPGLQFSVIQNEEVRVHASLRPLQIKTSKVQKQALWEIMMRVRRK